MKLTCVSPHLRSSLRCFDGRECDNNEGKGGMWQWWWHGGEGTRYHPDQTSARKRNRNE